MQNKFTLMTYMVIIMSVIAIWSTLLIAPSVHQNKIIQVKAPAVGKSADNVKKDVIKLKIIAEPIDAALSRITKKYFWLKVSPWHSPISPERFSWYHTWVDFETTPEEKDKEISVYTICIWPIILKKNATWYWWVVVQKCSIENQEVTVIYWHLKLKSISLRVNNKINAGQKIWILGVWFTSETWWERKHLHLGIHKWALLNIKWYVDMLSELNGWMDAQKLLETSIK